MSAWIHLLEICAIVSPSDADIGWEYRMELYQMRYFVSVARELNFTKAADVCGVSQPSLTKAIQKLEDEVGGPVFRREGRNTHLTELGKILRPRLEQAVALADLALAEAGDFKRMVNATLNLGCMCTIAPSSVIGIVEFFNQKAPQLDLHLHEASGARLVEMLDRGELDVALVALPSYPDRFQPSPLFTESYVIAFPRGHRFEQMDEVGVDDLRGERYLKRMNCDYLDFFEAAGNDYFFELDRRFKSEHETWVQAMIIAGMGCSIMPLSLSRHPEIRHRPLVRPRIQRTISVVTRRGRRHTPAVDFFVKLCRRISWNMDEEMPPIGDQTDIRTDQPSVALGGHG